MKKYGIPIALIALAAIFYAVSADGGPIDLQPVYHLKHDDATIGLVYYLEGGMVIVNESGGITFTCGCEPCYVPQPTDKPPTINPTDEPTQEPTTVPTHEPKPTEKPKCNKGGGNGSEGCDPGNHPEKGHDDE